MTRPLVLSSSSPARRMLLERFGLPFTTLSPDVDETPLAGESVPEMVQRLAIAKAQKSADSHPDALIIGADQVGVLGNVVLGKPLTRDKAIAALSQVSGNTVRFYTGLCLLDAASTQQECIVETFDVAFRKLTRAAIEAYVDKENILHCAGSFQADGLGIALIDHFRGEDYTALIGLPMIRLTGMLKRMGVDVLQR